MPDEPNRNAEEQLRAWAQKRREEAGAPLELHPAARKLLQDEVARTFPKESDVAADARRRAPLGEPNHPPPYAGGWLKLFWPRVALTGSICALLLILAGLTGPALFKAKSKTQRITAFNRLQQIGLAARIYAGDHDGKLPSSFQQMRDELGGASADKLVKDPETGKDFVYLGAGKAEGDRGSILAYSPIAQGRRPVLLGDGYVQEMDETQFDEALQRTRKGETTLALAAPTAAVPALAENKLAEHKVMVKAEPKDARPKPADQPARVEARKSPEKTTQLELAYAEKAKEAAPPPAGTPAVTRGLAADSQRGEVLLRQRYGPQPRRADAAPVVPSADKPAPGAAPQAAPSAGPQIPLETASVRRSINRVGGGTNPTALNGNAALSSDQNRAATDNSSLTLAQPVNAAAGRIVSLPQQREADQFGTANIHAYFADSLGAQAGQRYTQVRRYRVNFNSPPMPNVLRSFQVEQSGQQMRVLDADGSVYDGAIEPPVTEEVAKRNVASQTVASDLKKNVELEARSNESVSAVTAGEMAASQNAFFRVAGTNRTLNQLVVFQGNFLPSPTKELFLGAKLQTDRSAAAPQQNVLLQNPQLPNALIQGQATIGYRNRIQINALQVGP